MQKGKQSLCFTEAPFIISTANIVGKKEGEGPLAGHFDVIGEDDKFGQNTWEEAESTLQKEAFTMAIGRAGLKKEDIRYLFAGDLLGQTMATSFGVLDFQVPLFGLYGACSTCGESLSLGAMCVAAGYADHVVTMTSSHFASAEKQFRFPLEYANQRPKSATWTVTGSAAFVLGKERGMAKITGITTGKIVDFAEGKRMAQGQAAAPPGAAETQDGALLACILDMGELLLTSGAEVMRVEDTLTRLCMVYGFAQADVFTITSSIVLTVRTPEGRALTQTRRIRARDTDLGRVERVNALSRRLCAGPLPPEKFRQAVEEVRNAPAYPDAAQCAMYAVISAAFSVFFGGTLRDAATAAVSGMLLFGALRFCQRLRLNGILQSMLASALAALAVMLMVGFGLGQNPDKIIIGNIMLLIPGIALTTSLRDMINGDTISGLLGLSEAVLKALAIAIGFAAVLMRMGG